MKKEIIVFEKENEWDLPEQPDNFLKYWTEKLDQIPAKYRNNASIEVEAMLDYTDPVISVKVSYSRPETNKEKLYRELREKKRLEALKQSELRELERLSKKYNQAQEV